MKTFKNLLTLDKLRSTHPSHLSVSQRVQVKTGT